MFGNVSWGCGAPTGHLPVVGSLHPTGCWAPRHRAPSLPQQRGRRAAEGAVTAVCALRGASTVCGAAPRAERGEVREAGPNFPDGVPAPGPPGSERCRVSRPRAGLPGQRKRKPARPRARGCAEPGPAAARASGRVPGRPAPPLPGPGARQLRRWQLGFRKQGAAPRRKSSRSGRGRRAHTHFLHSSARARARRRKTGAPTARSGTLLRSQTSFLLFGTKFPSPKKRNEKKKKERKRKSQTQSSPPLHKPGRGNSPGRRRRAARRAARTGRAAERGGPSAPGTAAQRSAESGTRGASGRAVGVVGLHFQTHRSRRGKKLHRNGAKRKSVSTRQNHPDPRQRGRLPAARAPAPGGRDAVRKIAPKSGWRARPAGGRNAEEK